VDDSFTDFIIDQLRDVGGVEARKMFGGIGFYSGGNFFGIIDRDRLYFKTDANTALKYLKKKMKPFKPTPKMTLKTFHEVPSEILDNREAITEWAAESIKVAALTKRSAAKKVKRKKRDK
jgi:DNA transformation protein and related proteins